MSDNRKVLVAKRKDRKKNHNLTHNKDESSARISLKRKASSNDTPKKNIANDRLKKLRISLNEEANQSLSEQNKTQSASVRKDNFKKSNKFHDKRTQKRKPNVVNDVPLATKVPKPLLEPEANNSDGFIFNKEFVENKFSVSDRTSTATVFNFGQNNSIEDDDVEMEWCPTDDSSTTNIDASHRLSTCDEEKSQIYIVVDSNIFISNLGLIKTIISDNFTGVTPIIFIPWMVIEELDFIKSDPSKTNLRLKAQDAIKYIESISRIKHERLKGQTLMEANEQINTSKNPDDKIIASCLQVQQKYKHMILLTGDINLKNKAHFNNIPVCSSTEIIGKISYFNSSKLDVILNKMTNLCTAVIDNCARNAYGRAAPGMPICSSPPKTFQDCLRVFTKYWFPVFQEHLLKQFKKSIDDLSEFLKRNSKINDGSNEMNELLRLCVRVCLFLKDVECCKDNIENTIRDLNNIKNS